MVTKIFRGRNLASRLCYCLCAHNPFREEGVTLLEFYGYFAHRPVALFADFQSNVLVWRRLPAVIFFVVEEEN